jgi:sulfate permease, SulP family
LRTTLARRRIEFAVARDVGQFRDALGRSAAGAEQVPVYPTVHEAIGALDR